FGQVAKDALPGRHGENCGNDVLLFNVALLIEENEKESLVLLDRSAQAAAELISVVERLLSADEILEPALRGKRRVSVRIKHSSMKVVTAGTGLHFHLARTASGCCIDAVDDDLHFFDKIGTREHGRICAVPIVVSPVHRGETISRGVHLTHA